MSNEERRKKERQRAPGKKTDNNKEEANYKRAEKGEPESKLILIWNFSETKSQKNSNLFLSILVWY